MAKSPPQDRPDPATLSGLRALLQSHGIRPRKRLGQHFLISPQVADRILQAAAIEPGDSVLEIGAGAGALTRRLADKSADVIALEIDFDLVKVLQQILPESKQVRLLQGDILAFDLAEHLRGRTCKVLGNLPYYITGPILMRLVQDRRLISAAVVMVQEEVAQRICAAPGNKEYGALSVLVQVFFQPKRLFKINRANFFPAPEVDSATVSLLPRRPPLLREAETPFFIQVVKAAFAYRRKTLENSLTQAGLTASRGEALEALQEIGLAPKKRAEALSIEQFLELAKSLKSPQHHA